MQTMKKIISILFLALTFYSCQNEEKVYKDEIYKKPSIDPNPELIALSPEESMNKIHLPEGFKIELVASEPMVSEPIALAWDGNGSMYVAQLNTYMQDADATNENEPWSRVMKLDDTDGDGVMDKSSVFIDSLVLPRIVLPLDDRVLVGVTYDRNIYSYRDTDDDGVADEKILVLEDPDRDNRNLEHQDATMIWGLDNWLYVSNDPFRYRFEDDRLIRDTLPEPMPGQYGLTQDEVGRLFFSRAGGEIPALGFQQNPAYGQLTLKEHWDESFMEPWPIVGSPDTQGGPRRFRKEDNTLNRFTAVSGQEVYLGDKMPGAYGDLFIPEPVGRLIRRAKVSHVDGKIVLENRYDKAEFLASTDPLFRPVFTSTGPDGSLYIADMYRGIIQEGNWVGKGSYLREIVDERGYDKFFQRGRIYRVYHEEMTPGEKPQLLNKSAKELVSYLSHPNGWLRMTAQKLIILKKDASVVEDLEAIVRGNEGFFQTLFEDDKDYGLERLHALWTLEGLHAERKEIVKTAMKDADPRVRAAAVRIAERYIKVKDTEILSAMQEMSNDPDPEVLQQVVLTSRANNEGTKEMVAGIQARFAGNELLATTTAENLNPSFSEIAMLKDKYRMMNGGNQIVAGYVIFKDNCSVCHGIDGKGIDQLAPPLVGSPRVTGDPMTTTKILLHGLTGPIDGKEYNGPMASFAQYDDTEIANVLSYIRGHLNKEGTVWRVNVGYAREAFKDRKEYFTLKELESNPGLPESE
jgi:mono/diheme cytochrome c family protein/glucose/arabinose dehydrogenase